MIPPLSSSSTASSSSSSFSFSSVSSSFSSSLLLFSSAPTSFTSSFLSYVSLNTSQDIETSPLKLVVIKGMVHGVFYRNWTALFSGRPEKVEDMEQRCRRGPPTAMVSGLQVFPCTDDPGTTFKRKPTV
ncbi:hypothetical protein Pfo_028733 [Paulownia fortunei]|nr:hypothetical protein Pfo_028733 [Paulownia fortunei]